MLQTEVQEAKKLSPPPILTALNMIDQEESISLQELRLLITLSHEQAKVRFKLENGVSPASAPTESLQIAQDLVRISLAITDYKLTRLIKKLSVPVNEKWLGSISRPPLIRQSHNKLNHKKRDLSLTDEGAAMVRRYLLVFPSTTDGDIPNEASVRQWPISFDASNVRYPQNKRLWSVGGAGSGATTSLLQAVDAAGHLGGSVVYLDFCMCSTTERVFKYISESYGRMHHCVIDRTGGVNLDTAPKGAALYYGAVGDGIFGRESTESSLDIFMQMLKEITRIYSDNRSVNIPAALVVNNIPEDMAGDRGVIGLVNQLAEAGMFIHFKSFIAPSNGCETKEFDFLIHDIEGPVSGIENDQIRTALKKMRHSEIQELMPGRAIYIDGSAGGVVVKLTYPSVLISYDKTQKV